MQYLESTISGNRSGWKQAALRSGLFPISWLFLRLVRSRRWLYSRRIPRIKHLPCKVISVGNVVAGGSGKTPAVIFIARLLQEHARLRPAILSRGYRSKAHKPAIVSDGQNILLDSVQAGDESHMMAHSLPGVPVLIGKNRFQTGLIAIRKWDCQVAVLDDGFQYLKLARDVDIVTMDATRPFGLDHVLPRGYLREPLSTLKHADLILLTRVDQCGDLDSTRSRIAGIAPSVPIFESIHEPRSLRSPGTGEEIALDAIRGRNTLAVCGIANPQSFVRTLHSLGAAEVVLQPFPDHHPYPRRSIDTIRRRAEEARAEFIVTTEKDAPKLSVITDYTVLSLKIELRLVDSTAGDFMEFLRKDWTE